MSGVERPNSLFMPRFPKKENPNTKNSENQSDERPWENNEFSKDERRFFALGAMSASALIALIFIACFGIAIALMVFFIGK
jgi:hypothetical protein